MRARSLPPLWLSSAALASAITVAFGLARWIDHFRTDPYAEDARIWIVAARVGLQHGWSHIYDPELQRLASAGFGSSGSIIDARHLFVSPPPAAWLMVPLAPLSIPAGYLVWTLANLAALGAAWWLVCRGSQLQRATLLLVALALYPMHYQFWLGQWVVADLFFVAVAWWLLDRDRPVLAGALLAVPFFLKPQDVALVPLALLVSGRWRPLIGFALVAAVLGAASLASLGPSGVSTWLNDLGPVRANPYSSPMTFSSLFGRGALATSLEVFLGLSALGLAWYRRDRLDLVFALGLAGTTASAGYLHEDDIAILVLAAWIMLRTAPSTAQRIWLLAGLACAQVISLGQPIPMLLWQPVWILLLGLEGRPIRLLRPAGEQLSPTRPTRTWSPPEDRRLERTRAGLSGDEALRPQSPTGPDPTTR